MDSNNRNGSSAAPARGLMALFAIMLAMGLGLLASAEAAPFAYVTHQQDGTVSVIDTNPPSVVATVPVGSTPIGVAVTPDGKRAYVTIGASITVSVIATATNTVVATVTVGTGPEGVAITPDGKHAYVVNSGSNNVSVIDTVSNTVVGTPIPVGLQPTAVAVAPDGKHAYVANGGDPSDPGNNVLVIDTATNTVVAVVPVGLQPIAVAVTPDGKHVYVANTGAFSDPGTVSVIATASNTVVSTVAVGDLPLGVGIVPPPPGIPFLAFNAKLVIQFGSVPNHDALALGFSFTLSSTDSNGIDPLTEAVTLQIGTFTATIPPGSFKKNGKGFFVFAGVIDGVDLGAVIKPTGTLRYLFEAKATGPDLTGTKNAVYATLTIGDDSGATSVTAAISP